MQNIYLISYDISSNKLRLKIANKLLYYGLERVQLSVFLGGMTPTLFAEAQAWLQPLITGKDKLLILPLPPQIVQKNWCYGDYSINWDLLTQQQHTLYINW